MNKEQSQLYQNPPTNLQVNRKVGGSYCLRTSENLNINIEMMFKTETKEIVSFLMDRQIHGVVISEFSHVHNFKTNLDKN